MKRSHAIALGATGIILAGAWLGSAGNQRVDSSDPAADSGTDAKIFTSLDECLQASRPLIPGWKKPDGTTAKPGDKTPGQLACESDFKAATESHVATAPKFSSESECANQYGAGQCRSTNFNGTSVFVPAMVGFMVANYLSNQRNRNAQALFPARQSAAVPCPPGVTPAQQPGCLMPRTSSSSSSGSSYGGWRSYSTSSGHTVSRNTSAAASVPTKVPSGAATAPAVRTSLGAAPFHPLAASRSASSSSRSSSSFSSSSRSSSSRSSLSSVFRGGFGSSGHSISSRS